MTEYKFPKSTINAGWLARFPAYKLCIDTPRLDTFTDEECARLIVENPEFITKCAMKVIPTMMGEEFPEHWEHPAYDDMVSAAQEGLINALYSWDHRRGARLVTWIWRLARRAAQQERDKQQEYNRIHESYHDDMMYDEDVAHDFVEPDWMGDESGAEAAMEAEATIQMLNRRLGDTDGRILDMMVEGWTHAEIAERFGKSRQWVTLRIAAVEAYIKENS